MKAPRDLQMGNAVAALIKEAGLTHRQVAERCNLSTGRISQVVIGLDCPPGTVARIAQACGYQTYVYFVKAKKYP